MIVSGLLLLTVSTLIGSGATIWLFDYFKRRQNGLPVADGAGGFGIPVTGTSLEGSFVGDFLNNRDVNDHPQIVGEAEVIEAAKRGDAEAFSKLYALHKRRVYVMCAKMLGNVPEAEDMTQEVFLQAFRKLGNFRGEATFAIWLHLITRDLVLAHVLKKGLNPVSPEEPVGSPASEAPKREFSSRDVAHEPEKLIF